jgi:hypothetical protein
MLHLKSVVATTLILCCGSVLAQSGGGPSGRGSVTGDPAASSATPGTSPTTGMASQSRSGSGTSSSGGSDANGDQGRDKMPESNKTVLPLDQQHKPDNGE